MPLPNLTLFPEAFDDTFARFFEMHLAPNLPTRAVVERLWNALVTHVGSPETPELVARHFSRYTRYGYPYGEGACRFFVGDNSPAVWMYARSLDGSLDGPAVQEHLRRRDFPIAMVCSTRQRGENRDHWKRWGLEAWITSHFYRQGFYLAHVADAAEGLGDDTSREALEKRMLRLLCPLNYLPMPTHQAPTARRRFHYVCADGRPRDLSLQPGVKEAAKVLLADLYGAVVRDFLERVGEPVGAVAPAARLTFRRRDATTLPERQEATGALVLVPSGDGAYLQVRAFGVAYCGADGTEPFDVVVRFADVDVTFFDLTVEALGDWDATKPDMLANKWMNNRNLKVAGSVMETTRDGYAEFERAVAEGRYESRGKTPLTIRQRGTGRTVTLRVAQTPRNQSETSV